LGFAIPAGAIAATAVYIAYGVARANDASTAEARTVSIIVLLIIGLDVLVVLARPMTTYRRALVLAMIGLSVGALALPFARDLIDLHLPTAGLAWLSVGCAAGGCLAIAASNKIRGARYVTGEDEPGADAGPDATMSPVRPEGEPATPG
jgi:cation-transporting ATPase E